jgi:hypothetical protein
VLVRLYIYNNEKKTRTGKVGQDRKIRTRQAEQDRKTGTDRTGKAEGDR